MADIVPATRPRMSFGDLMKLVSPLGIDPSTDKVFVAGVRGYYRDSMGAMGKNDRGIYDDAIFLVSDGFFGSYNGNTDPSRYRAGRGFKDGEKGMATLTTGLWRVHRFDFHRGEYLALCQRAGPVKVMRDGHDGPYEHTGDFGINIHSGSWNSTSSLGCQTIHKGQWDAFIASAKDLAQRHYGTKWNKTTIPYVLIDNPTT